ncbi:MAG: FimB/Mfa2 family fimbrial subunit [Tannerellaceae bacterium]|nr:FimB/Mfa2 family fimbrial subunit [Tannerellaceae bacterium]
MDSKRKIQQVNSRKGKQIRTFISSFGSLIILSFLLLSLPGCIKDQVDDCQRETQATLTLQLDYGNSSKQPFSTYIPFVDILLFSSDTLLFQHIRVQSTDLPEEPEITLTLEPDDYFIIAWGSHREEVWISNPENDLHLNHFVYQHEEEAIRAGHLYYAPAGTPRLNTPDQYVAQVTEGTETIHPLAFMSATHIIHIYIRGLDDITRAEAFVENVPTGYDAHLTPLYHGTGIHSQVCTSEEIEGELVWHTSFYIPHFDNENEITVGVRVEEKAFYHTRALAEYMRTYQLSVADGDACEIPIVFEYKEDVLVQITLPTWDSITTEGKY